MKRYILTLCITLQFFNISITNAKTDTIRWVTESWQNYTNKDGSGLYHDIVRTIFVDQRIEVIYMPWKRTLLEVKNGTADMTGATSVSKGYVIPRYPILATPISILYSKNKIANSDLSSLTNYIGVWASPYEDELFLGSNRDLFKGFSVQERETAYKLLVSGRADYFLDTKALHLAWLEKQQSGSLDTSKTSDFRLKDISSLNLFMIFSDNPRGKRLRDIFDAGMENLIDSGELSKMYKKYHFLEQMPNSLRQ
jgi:ABC-type amino acid transport substrate-binding protein